MNKKSEQSVILDDNVRLAIDICRGAGAMPDELGVELMKKIATGELTVEAAIHQLLKAEGITTTQDKNS